MNFFLEPYRQYANFKGRDNRKKYWMFHLFYIIFIGAAALGAEAVPVFGVLFVLFGLVSIIPVIAIGARRLHDTNKSGWWQLIAIIPFGTIVLIIFFLQKGTEGDNMYGSDPLDKES